MDPEQLLFRTRPLSTMGVSPIAAVVIIGTASAALILVKAKVTGVKVGHALEPLHASHHTHRHVSLHTHRHTHWVHAHHIGATTASHVVASHAAHHASAVVEAIVVAHIVIVIKASHVVVEAHIVVIIVVEIAVKVVLAPHVAAVVHAATATETSSKVASVGVSAAVLIFATSRCVLWQGLERVDVGVPECDVDLLLPLWCAWAKLFDMSF